jgi:ribose transport system substrate-binding protein
LCAAVGVGAVPEAREEIRKTDSRLIGSVGVFPEKYGQAIMEIARDLLHGRELPPVHYAEHELITAQNINSVYAADFLVGPAVLGRG